MAERSDEQAKLAFTDYSQAAQEAVSTFDQWIEASQVGAQGISKKAMKFAQRNVLSAFDFAQKIVQAKDIDELIRMQTEFVQWQIQVLSRRTASSRRTAVSAPRARNSSKAGWIATSRGLRNTRFKPRLASIN